MSEQYRINMRPIDFDLRETAGQLLRPEPRIYENAKTREFEKCGIARTSAGQDRESY
jgi:hypothetical protein